MKKEKISFKDLIPASSRVEQQKSIIALYIWHIVC